MKTKNKKNSKRKMSTKSKLNPWSTNQSIYNLDIYNLSEHQQQLLIKQSKRNIENSFLVPESKEYLKQVLDDDGLFLWSCVGVLVQQSWVSSKYRMNLQEYILSTREYLNSYNWDGIYKWGWDENYKWVFLTVFCGKEIGEEVFRQTLNYQNENH